ncbi:MAG: LPXTG cell wall anchor domain-containing protein [Lactobacillus delbrueckii]|nr:LPXTG cell wall anchor domain-containing protein [Lactobacillus delbrueckii]MCH4218977.1 LPXTG cell wall anchor domain-containing protein [Lactobacillus delbrueckii]MCH4252474.1 LPXTG cell wall anchor domain-containing protein [Lactobacillus delbrueckii]
MQVVVPYKQTISVSQESKTLSEQIKFVDEYKIGIDTTAEEIFNAAFGKDGDQYSISDDYKSDTVTLTRDVYTNDVTGEKTYGNWTVSSGFNAVDNPTIDNYKIDSSKIYEQFMGAASALASTSAENIGSVSADTILKEADTITDGAVLQLVVPYTVVPTTPTKPDVPTTPTTPDVPTTPTTPDEPTTPVVPNKPTTPTVPSKPTTPNEPTNPTVPSKPTAPNEPTTPTVPSKPTAPNEPTTPTVPSKPATPNVPTTRQLSHGGTPSKHKHVTTSKSNETTLPQTGEKKSNYNLVAMILTLLSALLFAFTGKKHKKD